MARSKSAARALQLLENLLRPLQVLEYGSADATAYARMREALESKGKPIGPLDALVAAQAVSRELTLVTNNEREFRRVAGLHVESWVD